MDNDNGDYFRDFKLKHYENIDVEYWKSKVNGLQNRFKRLKNPKKRDWLIMELYATYLQLLEVLFINLHAATQKPDVFPVAIFIESEKLKEFITKNFQKSPEPTHSFFDKSILEILGEFKDTNEQSITCERALWECSRDYLDDYQLLNAYKHGYRVTAKYGEDALFTIDESGNKHPFIKYDSGITYFSKEAPDRMMSPKSQAKRIIYKRQIHFKREKVFMKATFVLALLQIIKYSTTRSLEGKYGRKIIRIHIDKQIWKKSSGGLKVKSAMFEISP